jgi:hypothetical protein
MKNNINTWLLAILAFHFFTTNLLASPKSEKLSSNMSINTLTSHELKNIHEQAYIKGFNSKSEDKFGRAVAISGNTMVIGARLNDSNAIGVNGEEDDNAFSVNNSGAAYVYVFNDNEWLLQAYIKPPKKIPNLGFGWTVAISEDTIVIGSSGGSSPSPPFVSDDETVYVYTRVLNMWSFQTTLSSSFNDVQNAFGISLAISGDTILVGSALASASGDFEGKVTVFKKNENVWNGEAILIASNGEFLDFFGFSVAVENDRAVIGAYNEDSNAIGVNGDEGNNTTNNSGAAYVFHRNGTEWTQEAFLKSSQSKSEDKFGWSVAISGETIVIGAKGSNFNNEEFFEGSAYVFIKEQDEWVEEARLLSDETEIDDQFGYSVAISGDNIIISAYYEDSSSLGINGDSLDNSSLRSGAAYLYNRVSGIWNQQYYLKASNTDANDNFGHSVSISGDTYVVGSPLEDSSAIDADPLDNSSLDSGAVYTFQLNNNIDFQAGHSALFYNPEQSGHGINVYMLADNRIIVIWYVYDDQGNQVWLLGVGTHNGTKATLDVTFNDGAMFPPDFDSADVNSVSWGQFELEFSDCNDGLFKWMPLADNGFTAGETNVTRLTASLGLTCSDANTSLTASKDTEVVKVAKPSLKAGDFTMQAAHSALWYNPEQSGHGINVYMLDDNRIIVIWYVYDDQGNQVWLLGVGTHDGINATLDVTVTSGAMFPPNFNAGDVSSENWGQFELEFSGCNDGLFKWLPVEGNGYIQGETNVTRLTATLGLTCSD